MSHYGQVLVIAHGEAAYDVSICVNDLNGNRLPSSFLIQLRYDGLHRWYGISDNLGIDFDDNDSRLRITGTDEIGE